MHYRLDACFDPSTMDTLPKTNMTNGGKTAIFQLAILVFGSVILSCQPLGPLLKVKLLVGYISAPNKTQRS